MKKIGIGTVIVAMLATASANAADRAIPCCAPSPPPSYAPPPPPPAPLYIYPWMGPYIGVNAGFNWQNGPWVYGVESDVNLSSASDRFADIQFSNPAFGTFRGRAGYTINNFLVYSTAGFAWGINSVTRSGLSDSSLHVGWTIGAGVELGLAPFGFSPAWSVKAEYLHLGLSQGVVLPNSVPINFPSNVLRFGINYHF